MPITSQKHVRPVFLAFLMLAAVMILAVSLGAVAQEPRVLNFAGEFVNASFSGFDLPDSGTMNVKTTAQAPETNEPPHTCRAGGANAGTYSVWMVVGHPGGTLTVDTSASDYDTVVSLYRYNTEDITQLENVACKDTSGGGDILDASLPSESYYLHISRVETDTAAAPSLNLNVAISATSPASQQLNNDDLAEAQAVTVGNAVKTKHVQFSSIEAGEDTLTCDMQHSVWYTFVVPVNGLYNFSTAGSSVRTGSQFLSETVLAVYRLDGALSFFNLDALGCNDGISSSPSAVLTDIALLRGDTIYVQVGTNFFSTMLQPSTYRLKITVPLGSSLFENFTFESGALTPGWTLKKGAPGDGVASVNPLIGIYHFRFTGATAKSATFSQKWTAPGGLRLLKDTIFHAHFSVHPDGSVKATAKLTVTYSDGTPKSVVSVKLPKQLNLYRTFGLDVAAASSNVKAVTFQIKDKTAIGTLDVDNASLSFYSDVTRGADGVLPAPPSP